MDSETSNPRQQADKLGILVTNLGTPDSPATADVRRFLGEFLWDPEGG